MSGAARQRPARSQGTGQRIRARRLDLGLRQADLAREVGISASYLNLIEHDRRQVGGKLLGAIAQALGSDVGQLAEGAQSALIDGLRSASLGIADPGEAPPEVEPPEDFAARFPNWAALAVAQARRIAALERAVESLNDRMAHDPFLSESLHDVLSSVTAIRSASGILVGDGGVDAEWQARFHRNIHEDSQRLAESAQSLVHYLDGGAAADSTPLSPQEEVEAWLAARDHALPEIETDAPLPPPGRVSAAAAVLIADLVAQLRADAAALPRARMRAALDAVGADVAALATTLGGDLGGDLHRLFRRLAFLPEAEVGRQVGLLICDSAGALRLRKPVAGFDVPRFGAGCPLWPLYRALSQPMTPLHAVVEPVSRLARRFEVFAVAQPMGPARFGAPAVLTSAMLILTDEGGSSMPAEPVGPTCRICPAQACAARREPSIVAPLQGA